MKILSITVAALAACAPQSPHDQVDVSVDAAIAPTACIRAKVRTVMLARFWRGGVEVPCSDVVGSGYSLEFGPLGSAPADVADVFDCYDAVAADPARRYFTGVLEFDVARFAQSAVRLVDPDGQPASVETWVSHTPQECEAGVAYRSLSIEVRP